jgi:hypothetical protein
LFSGVGEEVGEGGLDKQPAFATLTRPSRNVEEITAELRRVDAE